MSDKPLTASASLIGGGDWRGVGAEFAGHYQPVPNVELSAGADVSAGQGKGFYNAEVSPYLMAEIGPVDLKASQDYYGFKSGKFQTAGQGGTNLSAGIDIPVGSGRFNARINRVMDQFRNSTSGQVNFNVPF